MNAFEKLNTLDDKEKRKIFADTVEELIEDRDFGGALTLLDSTDDIKYLARAVKRLQDRMEHHCAHPHYGDYETKAARKKAKKEGDIETVRKLGREAVSDCELWARRHGWKPGQIPTYDERDPLHKGYLKISDETPKQKEPDQTDILKQHEK